MFTLLLIIIYIAFISLGLPDGLLGAAWPAMRLELGAPISYAGIISMIIAGGTIISGLMSDKLNYKLGTGMVTAISVAMTAVALFGFSVSSEFWMVCLWAVPYGLGAGAVDAALNNYVALHYAARHMSWLHCFWGVGASAGPYIMGYFLQERGSWADGYRSISVLQLILTTILIISLPLWRKVEAHGNVEDVDERVEKTAPKPLKEVLSIQGVKYILFAFFGYCALETTAGLWASSYLVEYRGTDTITAARFAALFYMGITLGRFISGFVTDRLGDRTMIRIGIGIIILGLVFIVLPIHADTLALAGLIVVGLGCAPIYPAIIHSTPDNFGRENSQAIIGVQMASAYAGSTFMPPVFGLIAGSISVGFYPVYMAIFAVLMLVMTERKINRR